MNRLLIFLLLLISGTAQATVIFEDNFNNQPDWHPTSKLYTCYSGTCPDGIPVGWTYWRNDEMWTPYGTTPTVGSETTIRISSDNYYGASGKSFTVWNESNNGYSGDGWGADGILAKRITDRNEIYVQIKLKFQPGFELIWNPITDTSAMQKIFRAYHFDGSGSPFLFGDVGNAGPGYFWDTVNNKYGNEFSTSMRCDPQATQYFCPGNTVGYQDYFGSPPWGTSPGSGNWHTLAWHLKLNTSIGVQDGVVEFWMDGVQQLSKTNMDWIRTGGDINAGWNVIAIGGNAFNNYAGITNTTYAAGAEQWYAIDDVVISDSPIPTDYTIGGSVDTTAPVITAFVIQPETQSLTVDIGAFTATDAIGVTGYCAINVNNSSGCSWSATAPTAYTFPSIGLKTLYAFARDAAGNISTVATDEVNITTPTTPAVSAVNGSMTGSLK